MPIDLSDVEETYSLLVPAYGVTHDTHAARGGLDPARLVSPAKDESETYGLIHRDDWYLQPRGTVNFMFGASALFNEAVGPVGARRIIRLREAEDPMPEARANTCLMVQGLRTCVRRREDHSELVRGYAAWAGPEGAHRWVSEGVIACPAADRVVTKSVLFGRVGRCALYAPVGDGKARILLLDFHIADREETAPDLLLIWASCAEIRVGGIPHQDPRGERLSDEWNGLIGRAVDGYREACGP